MNLSFRINAANRWLARLRPIALALGGTALLWAILFGIRTTLSLERSREAVQMDAIVQSLRARVFDAEQGCVLAGEDHPPDGLIARLNDRRDLRIDAARARRILGRNPVETRLLEQVLADIDSVLDAGRESALLAIDGQLAWSSGDMAGAARKRDEARLAAEYLHDLVYKAAGSLSALEAATGASLQEVHHAARNAEALFVVGLVAILLLVGTQWRSARQKRKHLQGARLVEDMLEAYSRRLEAMNAELEQVNLLKTQFLANTSHELLTPLNGIMGSLELLRDEALSAEEERQDILDKAYHSSERLLSLIHDLLDLCRLEEGDLALSCRTTAFGLLLDRALAAQRSDIDSRRLALLVVPPAEGWPRVHADPDRVRQVLQHLLGNSLKFTEEGSIRITGRIERDAVPRLRVEIADTGVGIDEDKLPAVFDLFRQADGSNTRRFGGTGVGLTLSRHLVKGMGGEIGIESEGAGKGTRVWFTLPLGGVAMGDGADPAPDRHAA